MDNQFKQFAHNIVSELVDKRVIVREAGTTLTLVKPIWGYQGPIEFRDEAQATTELENALVTKYGGLRAAG